MAITGRRVERAWMALVVVMVLLLGSLGQARAEILDSEDLGEPPLGALEGRCPPAPAACFDVSNFSDGNGDALADPFSGDASNTWGSSRGAGEWSSDLCCAADGLRKQRFEVFAGADNAAAGPTDCRDTPVYDSNPLALVCAKAGGDTGMGRSFVSKTGEIFQAIAWVKLFQVNQPQPGMFRARLTIHGWDSLNRMQQECNAYLPSTVVNGPDGQPLPGTVDQDAVFVPIEIPACEMVDNGQSSGGVGNAITKVDVAIRANNFKNDIAYGKVIVERVLFRRLEALP